MDEGTYGGGVSSGSLARTDFFRSGEHLEEATTQAIIILQFFSYAWFQPGQLEQDYILPTGYTGELVWVSGTSSDRLETLLINCLSRDSSDGHPTSKETVYFTKHSEFPRTKSDTIIIPESLPKISKHTL